jgi:hypothetical protein
MGGITNIMFAAGWMVPFKKDDEMKELWKFFYGPKRSLYNVVDNPPPDDKEKRNAYIVQMYSEVPFETKFRKIAIWEDAKCHWRLLQEPLTVS